MNQFELFDTKRTPDQDIELRKQTDNYLVLMRGEMIGLVRKLEKGGWFGYRGDGYREFTGETRKETIQKMIDEWGW